MRPRLRAGWLSGWSVWGSCIDCASMCRACVLVCGCGVYDSRLYFTVKVKCCDVRRVSACKRAGWRWYDKRSGLYVIQFVLDSLRRMHIFSMRVIISLSSDLRRFFETSASSASMSYTAVGCSAQYSSSPTAIALRQGCERRCLLWTTDGPEARVPRSPPDHACFCVSKRVSVYATFRDVHTDCEGRIRAALAPSGRGCHRGSPNAATAGDEADGGGRGAPHGVGAPGHAAHPCGCVSNEAPELRELRCGGTEGG